MPFPRANTDVPGHHALWRSWSLLSGCSMCPSTVHNTFMTTKGVNLTSCKTIRQAVSPGRSALHCVRHSMSVTLDEL